jgi:hypothetical protein
VRRSYPRWGRFAVRWPLFPIPAGGRAAAIAAITASSMLAPATGDAATTATASPATSAAPLQATGSHVTLAELEARAAKLSRQYRGQIVQLTDSATAAKKAAGEALLLRRQLAGAQQQAGRLAVVSYISGGFDPTLTLLAEGDTQRALDRTATVAYLARQRGMSAQRFQQLAAAANRAEQDARAKVAGLRRLIAALMSQQRTVERLLAKFQPQSPTIGGDRITARMRLVKDEIDRRFGPFPSIGCYRPESSGEHPLGRACDFMLSSGGVMPAAPWVQRGYDIAAWAQANASRLGIMYIIYRQRIWDIRMASAGWVLMADRGGITANHFDHVHISVF